MMQGIGFTGRWMIALALMLSACSSQTQLGAKAESETARPAAEAVAAADPAQAGQKENPDVIESGDFVTVHYSLRLQSGELVLTSSRDKAQDSNEKKVAWFFDPEQYGPEKIIAGQESRTPELAAAVIGMAANQKKSVPLSAESGFGSVDESLIKSYPTVKRVPRNVVVTAEEFVSQFKKFPKIGQEVNLTPYFTSKVVSVSDNSVTLEAQAEAGKVVASDFGDTRISVAGDEVLMTLSPVVGAPFTVMDRTGVIVEAGGESFKVDYNHPGAGKTLVLDVEVLSFLKSSAFKAKELAWVEDHELGIDLAGEKKKPMVLVLYAEWCGWSQRFLTETVKDPRIQAHWEDFVWVKVDSDKEKAYHELYGQTGYPLVVLLDPQGEVIKKLDGFKDARDLVEELEACLAHEMKRPA